MSIFYSSKTEKLPTYLEVAGAIILVLLVLAEWWATFLTVAPIFVITVIAMRSNAKYDRRSRQLRDISLREQRKKVINKQPLDD